MRNPNFEGLLVRAKEHPDLPAALAAMGYSLKRVGNGIKFNCTQYRLTLDKGKSGDYSALVFCENADGSWCVFDNKQRLGKLAYDAIGCMTSFFGMSFDEAVTALSGGIVQRREAVVRDETKTAPVSAPKKDFALPEKTSGVYSAAFAYLSSRGISGEMIRTLVKAELLYQTDVPTSSSTMPAVVFPIYNEKGEPVGADSCGAYNFKSFRYKHVYAGSDPAYGWHFANHTASVTTETPIFYCESAIDAMSLCLLTGFEGVYVSMAGCKDVTFNGMQKVYGGRPVICTDSDEAGDRFRERFSEAETLRPAGGKDWNDELQFRIERKIPFAMDGTNQYSRAHTTENQSPLPSVSSPKTKMCHR